MGGSETVSAAPRRALEARAHVGETRVIVFDRIAEATVEAVLPFGHVRARERDRKQRRDDPVDRRRHRIRSEFIEQPDELLDGFTRIEIADSVA